MASARVSRRALFVLLTLVLLVLCANAVLFLRVLDTITFPHEVTELDMVRGGARAVVEHYEAMATAAGLASNVAVRDVLARLRFEIEESTSSSQLVGVITRYVRDVNDVFEREHENNRRNHVFKIVSEDRGVQSLVGTATIIVSSVAGSGVELDDPMNILTDATVARLSRDADVLALTSIVEIQVVDGKCTILASRSLRDRLSMLTAQNSALRATLDELRRFAGLSELTGSGVRVRVFGPPDQEYGGELISERDVRDLVNELRVAGATGIEVGGERLIATSFIRSSGSQLLVNGRTISLNPLEIRATGDPLVLQSSLELLRNSLSYWGITVEVIAEELLTLRAYQGV
jgi:hypothetical protein